MTVACFPLLVVGPQSGHSLDYELSWSSRFSSQLLDGEAYPRWLLTMNDGAGSPAFFFYPPVSLYFTSVGFVLCGRCSATTQLGIGEWLIFLGSGISFYVFARGRTRQWAAVVAAIVYALAPYHLIDLAPRQAIAEATTYVWIPVLWLFLHRMAAGEWRLPGFAVSYALLVATHLPSALLVSLLALIYVGVLAYHRSAPRMLLRFFSGIIVGIMVSGLYLVPALLSQEYIHVARLWDPYYSYDRWFLLDGVAAPDHELETMLLGALLVYSAVFASLCIVGYRQAGRVGAVTSAWLIVFISACFLMLPFSRVVWEYAPFLKQVQFPWRIFVVLDMAIGAVMVETVPRGGSLDRSTTGVIAGTAAVLLTASTMVGMAHYVNDWSLVGDAQHQAALDARLRAGNDPPEYLPSWVTGSPEATQDIVRAMPRAQVDPGAGDIRVARWKPRHIELDLRMARDANVIVRQFYYPGWRATIDDGATELRIDASGPAGLIQVGVPAGRHTLRLTLTPLWQETAGAVLSGIGLASVLLIGIGRYGRRARACLAEGR